MVRAVCQRCLSASVRVNAQEVSRIKRGLVCLVGLRRGDTREDMEWLAKKIVSARLFEAEVGGEDLMKPWAMGLAALGLDVLCVSQFTLHASMKGAKKPSFHNAMGGKEAKPLYYDFLEILRREYDHAAGSPGGSSSSTTTTSSDADGDCDDKERNEGGDCRGERKTGVEAVADGVFGAMMELSLVNDGPVTIILDSQDKG